MWQDELVTAGVPGMVGLAGIIGTFFAPTWAQRSIAQRAERREFRRARRLVVEELQTIERDLKFLSNEGRIPRLNKDQMLPTSAWDKFRDVLAMSLSDPDWETLPTVMGSMELHRRLITSSDSDAPLTADALQFIRATTDAVQKARERLEKAKPVHD